MINDGELIRDIDYKDNVIYILNSTENRLDDYTPYPSEAINKRFPNFGGKGKEYLKYLRDELISAILHDFPIKKENIIYGGISLGGLHAIYSSYQPNDFKMFFGIVSSLWYPNFLDYLKENDPYSKDNVYFLLNGKKEGSKHKGIPLEHAYEKAEEASEILKGKSKHITFISDNYSHHEQMSLRFNSIQNVILEYLQNNSKK